MLCPTSEFVFARIIVTRHHDDGGVTEPKLGVHTALGVLLGASTLSTTGNKSVTGLGFKPRLVRFTVQMVSSTSSAAFGMGAMTDTSQFWTASTVNTSSSPANVRNGDSTHCFGWLSSGSTTPSLLASYVSMNPDGFTVNVSSASNSFDVWYEAIA